MLRGRWVEPPKASDLSYMVEDSSLFDFQLSDAERLDLATLPPLQQLAGKTGRKGFWDVSGYAQRMD